MLENMRYDLFFFFLSFFFVTLSIYNSIYEHSKVHGTVMQLRWERAGFWIYHHFY